MDITNDPAATPAQRIEALRAVVADEHFPSWVPESNNHIHTCFSFSPYTPTHAALMARRNGLRVVGSVDHDSIGAAAEMSEATRILGMGSVTGFEIRARFGEGTPLGRPIGGTPEAVAAVPRDAVWDHYRRTYGADSLVVAAAGAVEHEELCERVAADLEAAGWDASASARPRERRFETVAPAPPAMTDVEIVRECEQSHVYLACPGIGVRDERRWPMSVLTTILGGGMSSRLFQEVREKRGLAYSTYAFDAPYAGAGAFGLYAGCAPRDVEEVCAVMVGEFERLAADGVSERELRRARGQLRGAMVLGGEDSLARMGRLGRGEVVTGRLRSMEENLRRLSAVTAEEVREMAAWLAGHARARVLVGPRA